MIDDDSYFCDQCGSEIMVCSLCGSPGKGKRCTKDGGVMVSVKDRQSGSTLAGTDFPGFEAPAAPSRPAAVSGTSGELILVNSNIGANVSIKPGGIIGRANGDYAGVFGSFPMISSTHARIDFSGSWTVTDLGSTNGTTVNGQPAPANTPVLLRDQNVVKFANVEFIVRIPGGGQNPGASTIRM